MEANLVPLRQVAPSLTTAARPTTGQYLLELGLSTGTTVLVDGLRKSMLSRGPIPAAVATVVGSTVLRSAVYGVAEVGANLIHNRTHDTQRAWHDGVGSAMAYGARTGAISGVAIALTNPIYNATARHFPTLKPVALSVVAGTVTGSLSSALSSATNKDTWANGTGEGLKTLGTLTALGAARGAVSGGILKAVASSHPTLGRAMEWMPIGHVE